MNIFTRGSVNFLQQPRSNLTEALEHCSGIAVAKLQGCWRKFTGKKRRSPLSK